MPPKYLLDRSFCVLPVASHPLYSDWIPSISSFAADEVDAHIGMFNAKTNEGFYELGLNVAKVTMEAVESARNWDDDGLGFREMKDENGRTVLVEDE
jgi:hypothetical protein